jgi:hypothetical protein
MEKLSCSAGRRNPGDNLTGKGWDWKIVYFRQAKGTGKKRRNVVVGGFPLMNYCDQIAPTMKETASD